MCKQSWRAWQDCHTGRAPRGKCPLRWQAGVLGWHASATPCAGPDRPPSRRGAPNRRTNRPQATHKVDPQGRPLGGTHACSFRRLAEPTCERGVGLGPTGVRVQAGPSGGACHRAGSSCVPPTLRPPLPPAAPCTSFAGTATMSVFMSAPQLDLSPRRACRGLPAWSSMRALYGGRLLAAALLLACAAPGAAAIYKYGSEGQPVLLTCNFSERIVMLFASPSRAGSA